MGAIAGIINFDGKAVERNLLETMVATMGHRGGVVDYDVSANVGLCQVSYRKTGAVAGSFSDLNGPTARFRVVFHGRLDNREEILDQVGRFRAEEMPDRLVAQAAYEKWGRGCCERLLGDYSFVVWDQGGREALCVRDRMGVMPFYYVALDSSFAFASEIGALLALPGVSESINTARVVDFIVSLALENRTTSFRDVVRLPPGHVLIVKNGSVAERQYWHLEPADAGCHCGAEYREAFYEIFKDAVRARLRSDGGNEGVGAYLSGGLDSSAIVCMAAGPLSDCLPGRLQTYSGVFDTITECDERAYFEPVFDRYDIERFYLRADEIRPGAVFDELARCEDEPIFSPHGFMSWHLLAAAQRRGVGVMLDGHDGDAAVSYGYGLLPELALRGRLLRLYREFAYFPKASRKRNIKSIFYLYRGLLLSRLPFLSYGIGNKALWRENVNFITPSCRKAADIENRVDEWLTRMPDSCQTEQVRHRMLISQPFHPFALDLMERTASRFGIEKRFPFFDVRVISFCLGLPAEQKLERGLNRSIVRNALRDILPESIRLRQSKSNFVKNLVDAYTNRDRQWMIQSMNEVPEALYDIVERDGVRTAYEEALGGTGGSRIIALNRMLQVFAVSKWLLKNGA